MYRMADDFYTSLGFDPMPDTFWEKSMIVKPDHNVVCHPLAWNFFKGDVRLANSLQIKCDKRTNSKSYKYYLLPFRSDFHYRNRFLRVINVWFMGHFKSLGPFISLGQFKFLFQLYNIILTIYFIS